MIVRGDVPDPVREQYLRKGKRGRSGATGPGPGIANGAQGHVTGSTVGTGKCLLLIFSLSLFTFKFISNFQIVYIVPVVYLVHFYI